MFAPNTANTPTVGQVRQVHLECAIHLNQVHKVRPDMQGLYVMPSLDCGPCGRRVLADEDPDGPFIVLEIEALRAP